tara:strand:- start:230 stop:406 length:177 start_codon:yes stop_codon:yes gene_type:complete
MKQLQINSCTGFGLSFLKMAHKQNDLTDDLRASPSYYADWGDVQISYLILGGKTISSY